MENSIYLYETDTGTLPKECIMCGKTITDTEFEYEDYLIVFRGHTSNSCYGFICFKCYEERKAKRA